MNIEITVTTIWVKWFQYLLHIFVTVCIASSFTSNLLHIQHKRHRDIDTPCAKLYEEFETNIPQSLHLLLLSHQLGFASLFLVDSTFFAVVIVDVDVIIIIGEVVVVIIFAITLAWLSSKVRAHVVMSPA